MYTAAIRLGAILILTARQVPACGPAVHNEVVERARQWMYEQRDAPDFELIDRYRSILDQNQESLQAGVVFPDWGYGCLSMDDEAEEAHWTPFLEQGIEYLRTRYQPPFQEPAAQRLVAFLLGIASHQVADEQWHSLSGLRDGFMWVLAGSTFDGEYSRAHDALDVGGDFALAHMSDLSHIRDEWSVPMDDVLAIYRRMGLSVSRWKLRLCITRQFYAMEAVKRFGPGLFPSYAAKAPMLTERLDDYYIGGLFAMSTATSDCWRSLLKWFETGDYSRKCLVSDYRSTSHRSEVTQAIINQTRQRNGRLKMAEPLVDDSDGVLYIGQHQRKPPSAFGNRQHVFAKNNQKKQEEDSNSDNNECKPLKSEFPYIKQLYTTSAYSGIGTAIAMGDFTGSGNTSSIAISAPYFKHHRERKQQHPKHAGAVFVLNRPTAEYQFSQQEILDAEPQILTPNYSAPLEFPQFGASLAVIDFNADGIDDLAVGSSGYGDYPTASLLGRVDVYLGHKDVGLSDMPDFSVTAEELAQYTRGRSYRIGGHLFGEDVDGDGFADLLVGAPYHTENKHIQQTGRLFGYLSSGNGNQRRTNKKPDISITSPHQQPYEWFGFTARVTQHLNTTLMLVGAPGHHSVDDPTGTNITLAGRVYAFSRDEYLFSLTAWTEKTQLGSQIHVWPDHQLVLLGSPSERNSGLFLNHLDGNQPPERGWQAGQVRLFDPDQWTTKNDDDTGGLEGLLGTLRGSQSPGHFGRALATTKKDLWIGEPLAGITTEDGRIYKWQPKENKIQCFLPPSGPSGTSAGARFGHNIVTRSQGKQQQQLLAVSLPHDSQANNRLSGSILLMRKI